MGRRLVVAAIGLAALAAAVPVVAFGVIPLFARSRIVEPAPEPPAAGAATPAAEASGPTPAPSLVLAGDLRRVDPVHYGSGRVSISGPAGSRVLRFEGVDIAAAPNMFVYLSDASDGSPGRYTDLGPLKATQGSFNYQVPDSVDLGRARSVVVWCRAFQVTVTYAVLARPG